MIDVIDYHGPVFGRSMLVPQLFIIIVKPLPYFQDRISQFFLLSTGSDILPIASISLFPESQRWYECAVWRWTLDSHLSSVLWATRALVHLPVYIVQRSFSLRLNVEFPYGGKHELGCSDDAAVNSSWCSWVLFPAFLSGSTQQPVLLDSGNMKHYSGLLGHCPSWIHATTTRKTWTYTNYIWNK